MVKRIIITVGDGIDELLDTISTTLGKKKSVLARDLMENSLNDMGLIQWYLETKGDEH